MSTETQEQSAIVAIEKLPAVQLFDPAKIDPLLERIEAEARTGLPDVSTETGRKELASRAYRIAKMKTWFDDQRKTLVSEQKKQLSKIDAEGRRIWDRLESLQKEIRKPLTEFEDREKARVAAHEANLVALRDAADLGPNPSINSIQTHIQSLECLDTSAMEEFTQRANLAKQEALRSLRDQLALAEKLEADRLELERRRRDDAERAQKQREEAAARDAAAKARMEAERESRDREERERAAKERAIKDKLDAEARAVKAEADRKAAEERAEREKQEAIERERQRVAAEQDAARREQARRDADRDHRRSVNSAALKALVDGGVPVDAAKECLVLIAQGKVPNVRLVY